MSRLANEYSTSVPVIVAIVVFSGFIHVSASPDLGWGNLVGRWLIATGSAFPMIAIVFIADRIARRIDRFHHLIYLSSYLIGGLVRGIVLSAALNALGFTEVGGWGLRIAASASTMATAIAVATFAYSTYRTHADTINDLMTEQARLDEALFEISREDPHGGSKDAAQLASEIVNELERINLRPVPEQIRQIEALVQDKVKPLSAEQSRVVGDWRPTQPQPTDLGRYFRWSQINPVAGPIPMWLYAGISVSSFPAATLRFGWETASELALITGAILVPTAGGLFLLARRFVPRLSFPKNVLAFTGIALAMASIGVSGTVLALRDTSQPFAFVLPGLIAFPLFSWAVAIGTSFSQQYQARRNHLEEINNQLRWAIARINLVNWYNRGVSSRLLHGPIQNVLHATVIRLRGSNPRAIVDEALVQLKDNLSRLTSTSEVNNAEAVTACDDLEDIPTLWDDIANVSITLEPATRAVLRGDKALAVIARDMCHELVSNAIRHAGATMIHARLDTEPSVVRISINDNGKTPRQIHESGLGTTFIEQCSVRWDRFTGYNENHTTITLPRERFDDSVALR